MLPNTLCVFFKELQRPHREAKFKKSKKCRLFLDALPASVLLRVVAFGYLHNYIKFKSS